MEDSAGRVGKAGKGRAPGLRWVGASELLLATVWKLTLLTMGFAAGLAFAPVATAQPPQEQSSSCDSNYSGDCVPIASDVDCASGNGNGPAYVEGPVTVVGDDIYGLDNNNDGVGCEA